MANIEERKEHPISMRLPEADIATGKLTIAREEPATKVVDPIHHRPGDKSRPFCVGAYAATTITLA